MSIDRVVKARRRQSVSIKKMQTRSGTLSFTLDILTKVNTDNNPREKVDDSLKDNNVKVASFCQDMMVGFSGVLWLAIGRDRRQLSVTIKNKAGVPQSIVKSSVCYKMVPDFL